MIKVKDGGVWQGSLSSKLGLDRRDVINSQLGTQSGDVIVLAAHENGVKAVGYYYYYCYDLQPHKILY